MRVYSRKYQKVTGWWVYGHITPNGKIYIGYSGGKDGDKQCCDRWNKGGYKSTELQPYIEKHGWDNIKHIVFKDGLTKKQAEQLEDLLITQATIDGWCINKVGSGGEARDNTKEYKKNWFQTHKNEIREKRREYFKEYRENNKEELQKYIKKYRDNHKDELNLKNKIYRDKYKEFFIEYEKQWRSKPENLIYGRVKNYNRNHTPIETPLEAKNKYLEYGYIPSYIKNDDLV